MVFLKRLCLDLNYFADSHWVSRYGLFIHTTIMPTAFFFKRLLSFYTKSPNFCLKWCKGYYLNCFSQSLAFLPAEIKTKFAVFQSHRLDRLNNEIFKISFQIRSKNDLLMAVPLILPSYVPLLLNHRESILYCHELQSWVVLNRQPCFSFQIRIF